MVEDSAIDEDREHAKADEQSQKLIRDVDENDVHDNQVAVSDHHIKKDNEDYKRNLWEQYIKEGGRGSAVTDMLANMAALTDPSFRSENVGKNWTWADGLATTGWKTRMKNMLGVGKQGKDKPRQVGLWNA